MEDDLLWTESSVVDEEDEGGMGDNLVGDISDGLAGLAPRWISAYRLSPVLMGFHLVGNF